jgi:alpha-glucosidase
MLIRIAFTLLAVLCPAAQLSAADDVVLASPDGNVQFRLSLDSEARLRYSVAFREKPVIGTSAIGITVDGVNLAEGVELGKADQYKVNQTYPWNGVHSTAVDHSNGVKIGVTHRRSRTAYTVEVRAYNDGIAFRHIVPGEGTRVPDEATVFQVPAGSSIWYTDMESGYEGRYLEGRVVNPVNLGIRISDVLPGGYMAPPVTFMLPEGAGYASITEGRLRHYSGMGLQADDSGGLHARLAHAVEPGWVFREAHLPDAERLKKPASITGTITTPWRVVMIGADLNALVNCDIVHNVSDPPDPKLFPNGLNTDWIKPGRALWRYMDNGSDTSRGPSPTSEEMKPWADLGRQLGFEYNYLEGYWDRWSEAELKDLADYSRERGVKLIVWKYRNDFTDEKGAESPRRSSIFPRRPADRDHAADSKDVEKAIRAFFERCRRAGVAGVKIDYFDHEHKEIIELYETILNLAAEYRLLVDFHGANKPTGLERTYPNLLGQEAIRGMEYGPPYATHEVTLPFTRLLAGLADYTPMMFGGVKLADTTWAHQIGNAILLQAPLLVFSAHPANILANPAVDVIKSIPSVWDETVVLPVSRIGDVAAFARRKGNTWFLAVTNGPVAKTVRVDLSFLGGEGTWVSTLVRDTDEAAAVKIEHVTLRRSESLDLNLRSGGGFVGRFIPFR